MASQLEALTGEILEEAEKEAAKILEESDAETKRLLSNAETESKTKALEITNAAKNEAEAVKRKLLSEAKHKARLARLASRNSLVDETFRLVDKKTADSLAVKEARQRFFSRMLNEGLKEVLGEGVKVRLNKANSGKIDLPRLQSEASKLAPRVKIEWQLDDETDPNGMVVESADGKIRVVNSIHARLERLEREILIEIRRHLFQEQAH